MMIVVITSPELGKLLQKTERIPVTDARLKTLHRWLNHHQCKLQPTFPGVEDESMQVYFELLPSQGIGEQDLEELRQLPGIEGAYEKAAEEPPS